MSAGFRDIRRQLGVPEKFSDDVLQEAHESVTAGPVLPDSAPDDPIDRRDLEFVAIDPQGSTDLDQAYAAERTGRGYTVYYAIADVASLVRAGGAVDQEARSRGVTLYSPDLRTSLHPESISEGAGSLLEGRDRQALLWTIELGTDGEQRSARLERAIVRNRAQLSYHAAQQMIDSRSGAGADINSSLPLLREIGVLRQQQEAERGGVSLALASQEVVRRADGTYDIEYDESVPVENWNAQISLLTGIAASRIMIEGGIGLLRTLPPPDQHTISQLRRTAQALGIRWNRDTSYADHVRQLRPDSPQRAAMLSQSARGLRGAGYVSFHNHQIPEHPEHSAIASTYAHVTAPLRRLCDRFANEVVVALCADRPPPGWATEALEELPSLMGSARSKDRNLERAMVDYVEAVVLSNRVGESFEAVVTNVDSNRDRGRIQLRDPAVVANLAAAGLELGQQVRVRLAGTNPTERHIDFELA